MHQNLKQLNQIKSKVNEIVTQKQLKINPNVIVVTKTFSMEKITPIIESGHIHYGENKIQEAEFKWLPIKHKYKNLQLHMVGKLQSNKAKKAITLFDYIHSLDSEKLAFKIFNSQKELKKQIKLFIQVNIADENQKGGVNINNLNQFYEYCTKELSLNIVGLMCLPPMNLSATKYFAMLKNLADKLYLKELSMGMSSDFENAVSEGATYLRIGSSIMGKRNII